MKEFESDKVRYKIYICTCPLCKREFPVCWTVPEHRKHGLVYVSCPLCGTAHAACVQDTD